MKVGIIAKFKNDNLRQARLAFGYPSMKAFCQAVGLSYGTYCSYENFRAYPKKDALKTRYEEIFRLPFDDLFPPEYREAVARKMGQPIEKTVEIEYLPLPFDESVAGYLPDIAEVYEAKDLEQNLDLALSTLTDREAKVVKLRYGLGGNDPHSLQEIAKEFKLTRQRIMQIESKALRRLMHPSRSEGLRDLYNGRSS